MSRQRQLVSRVRLLVDRRADRAAGRADAAATGAADSSTDGATDGPAPGGGSGRSALRRIGHGAAAAIRQRAAQCPRGVTLRLGGRTLGVSAGRRAALLLAAAVVGAIVAGLPGSGTPATVAASAQDYGLGVAADAGMAGGLDDVSARQEITQAEAQARLTELAASRAARQPDFVVPLVGRETTCFCMRWGQMHPGLDIAAALGTPIIAASDGVVLKAGRASGFGNAIYIQDADGNVQIYGHMRHLYVEAGQVVHTGETIAKVGNEGYSTGPHLHFEIHLGGSGGRPIDPAQWFVDHDVAY